MSNSPAAVEVLLALEPMLAEQNVPWYLFGAQAAIIWGSPRLSTDVDITVNLPTEKLHAFIGAMNDRGFALRFNDAEFLAHSRVIPFIHQAIEMPLDVVLAGPGLEEDFFARAVPVSVKGTAIPVISPEDLIVMKILAGRAKDIEDIRAVIAAQRETLDVDRIRTLLELLQRALTQSDLLPEFEKHWSTA